MSWISTKDRILALAKKHRAVVGIGLTDYDKTLRSKVLKSKRLAENSGIGRIVLFDSPAELISSLKNGELDAAVRGNLSAHESLCELKRAFGISNTMRAALLELCGRAVFLAPVGIDECQNASEKIELVERLATLMKKLSLEPKVGVLSKGRKEDVRRAECVARSMREAEYVVKALRAKKIHAYHYEIRLENAVAESNLILVPDGVLGNLLFRALHLVCGHESFGAPVLNIDRVFIDTSRVKTDYVGAIAFAAAIVK